MKRLLSLIYLLIFCISCYEKISPSKEDLRYATIPFGYTEIGDSILFSIDESYIINYIDLYSSNFFNSPYAPDFNPEINNFLRKNEVKVQQLHLIGSFNDYKIKSDFALKFNEQHSQWELKLPKQSIVPSSGDFAFVANEHFLATPKCFEACNIHVPIFSDRNLKRMYIVWLMYILDTKENMGYAIENDSLVFTFDPSDYSLSNNNYGIQEAYDPDLIYKVQLAGSFNRWSIYFDMIKKKNKYQYKMPITKDIGNWGEFKFIVNDDNWVNPPFEAVNKFGHYMGTRHYNFTYQTHNEQNIMGYHIDGENVVFEWKLRENDLITYFQRSEARSYKIKNMYLYCDAFTLQKEQKMIMEEVDYHHYQLAIPLSKFKKEVTYEFNFFVNGVLELTPDYQASNISRTSLWDEKQVVRFSLQL